MDMSHIYKTEIVLLLNSLLTHSYYEYETFHTHECHSLFRKVILAVIILIYGETFFYLIYVLQVIKRRKLAFLRDFVSVISLNQNVQCVLCKICSIIFSG